MPKLAVITWYEECQNAPSKPDTQLVLIPDDPAERNELLLTMLKTGIGYGDDYMPAIVVTDNTNSPPPAAQFGDLQASTQDGSHMFATFVTLPEGS